MDISDNNDNNMIFLSALRPLLAALHGLSNPQFPLLRSELHLATFVCDSSST